MNVPVDDWAVEAGALLGGRGEPEIRAWENIDEGRRENDDDDHYDYNQMKVLLFEGVGGDTS